jgi:uncharacterized protein (TIGR00297 family)
VNEFTPVLFAFIVLISVLGWYTSNLSVSGALSASLVGIVIGAAFGWKGLTILGLFFVSSSLWSRFKKSQKHAIEQKLAKTSKRDWQQVLANGGPASIFSLLFIVINEPSLFFAFIVSIAAANSDTWASEIGPLSKGKPFSLRTLNRVEKGTSGAVSLIGTLSSLLGSFVIILFSYIITPSMTVNELIILTLFGFLGSIVDTLLGASIQVEYQCSRCGMRTEAKKHCSFSTMKVKGLVQINNEVVNFVSCILPGWIVLIIY